MIEALRRLVPCLALAAAACTSSPTATRQGRVVDGAWEPGDVVRLAWPDEVVTDDQVARTLRLTGEVPIEEGAFDLDTLLDVGAWEPPQRSCWTDAGEEEPLGGPGVPIVWAFIVSTAPEIPAGDLGFSELGSIAKAVTLQNAVVWASQDVTRDSVGGQRFGSSLHEGLQLVRLAECRIRVECQEWCVEPAADDAIVVLDRAPPR